MSEDLDLAGDLKNLASTLVTLPDRGIHDQELSVALKNAEMHLDYQPIVKSGDGRLRGTEALLRWESPRRGLVPPRLVIPRAEKSGLIGAIGRWALGVSCRELAAWHLGTSAEGLAMSMNMSAHEVMSSDFAAMTAGVLEATATDPATITLELTETAFVHDSERALVVLRELKHIGVNIALDDFGTGYSSLSYLQRFPIDEVKIDRSFVADMNHDPSSHAIVLSIINLAHLLGMEVVAEGVENEAQHAELRVLGCDRCQGYYFARPMSGDAIGALLRDGPNAHHVHLPDRTGQRASSC